MGEEHTDHLNVDQLKENDLYAEFLDVKFNARDYANTIIEGHHIGEALSKLSTGIDLLNKELLSQVADHHEDLLSQATGIETLEGVLQSITTRCQSLVKSVQRVRGQVVEPYNRISSRTKQLRRLQTTCEYLRRIIRILAVSKRLQVQLKGGQREITKAAQSLNELEYVLDGVDLSGIEIVENDLKQIKIAHVEVQKQAEEMLRNGLNSQNQTLIGTSLQVFHNLGSLYREVQSIIELSTNSVERYIKEAIDITKLMTKQGAGYMPMSGPGRSTMPVTGMGSSWNSGLWDNLELMMNNLYALCQKIYLLEKVLLKKRDPVTHASYIEGFSEAGCSNVFNDFWNSICSALRSSFDQASQDSSHLKQTFEGEYPKLLRIFNDFWAKISELVEAKQLSTTALSSFKIDVKIGFNQKDVNPLESLKSCLQPFENSYLSRSLSRLFDPINLVFPQSTNSIPSKEELNNIVKTISSELDVASVDEHLMIVVSKNISKTVQLYVTKCEQLLATTAEAGQLSGGLTNAQIRNASIVNSLNQLRDGICKILPNLVYPPQEAANVLDTAVSNIASFMDVALSFLLSAIMASLENKVSRMHSENFTITTQAFHSSQESRQCSKYVTDIQEFLSRVQSDYLSLYSCEDFMLERLELVTARLLELFIRHTCLIRDLSEGGKLKIAADMAQLEFSVTPLCRRFEELGHVYKQYRAFRPLLFQIMEDIPSNPNLGDSLPYSTALHFTFSEAPPQLVSPHTVNGWTISQYHVWLDEHPTEDERIEIIRQTVDKYTKKIKDNPSMTPSPVYNVMIKLLTQVSPSSS